IADRSQGFWRRLDILPFTRVIPGAERRFGLDNPAHWLVEAPGILNWALAGLDRLRASNWPFTEPERCRRAHEEYQLDVNPAKRFLTENYAAGSDDDAVSTVELYQEYKRWARCAGYPKPLADRDFARELQRAFPKVGKDRVQFEKDRMM